MNKNIIFMLVALILIANVSAVEKSLANPIKIRESATLSQMCDNCTYVNVTTLKFPNSTEITLDVIMTQSGTSYYYTLGSQYTQDAGTYTYSTTGNPDGVVTSQPVTFIVNSLGKTFTSSQAILYTLVFIVALVMFVLCLAFALYLPSNNKRDQMTGYIIQVEGLKYLKMFSFAVAYLMLLLMTYFGYMISYGYLDLDFLGSVFNFSFYALTIATLPLFIVGVYVVIANWIRDSKVAEMLQRGFNVK